MIACTTSTGGRARTATIATTTTTTRRIATRSATRRAASAAAAAVAADAAGPVAENRTTAASEAAASPHQPPTPPSSSGNIGDAERSGDGKKRPNKTVAVIAQVSSSTPSMSTTAKGWRGRRKKRKNEDDGGRCPADDEGEDGVGNGNGSGDSDSDSDNRTTGGKNANKKKNVNTTGVKSMPPFNLRRDVGGLSSAADLLRGRRNVLVLAGAGLSVSCGIPDFRSADGLYATLDAQELGLHSAEELFDLDVFTDDPRPFYKFAGALYPGSVEPSISHRFLGMLEENGMLLRLYTQNIDGLEEIAGVSRKRIVHAHGSLNWAQCMKCGSRVDSSVIAPDVRDGVVPRCGRSVGVVNNHRTTKKRQRSVGGESTASSSSSCSDGTATGTGEEEESSSSSSSSMVVTRGRTAALSDGGGDASATSSAAAATGEPPLCRGVIKPGVTFFGEKLSDAVTKSLDADRRRADALIVIGTSLSVAPMSKVLRFLPPTIPRILINRNHVSPPAAAAPSSSSGGANDGSSGGDEVGEDAEFRVGYTFDTCLLGNCDDVTRGLANELGWIDGNDDDGGGTRKNEDDNPRGAACGSSRADPHHLASSAVRERTFLFPGAVTYDGGRGGGDEEVEVEVREIAHCDGCGGEIAGTIMKCTTCFDYDLCETCFPRLSGGHFGGTHEFVPER